MRPKFIPLLLVALAMASCSSNKQLSQTNQSAVIDVIPAVTIVNDSLSTYMVDGQDDASKAMNLGANINTTGTDFAPFRYGDRLYYSSSTLGQNGAKPIAKVFSSVNLGTNSPWTENSQEMGIHTSNATFTPDGRRVYFTFCEDTPTGEQICEIYTRERAYEGYWLPYKRLPKAINLPGYTSTQPSVGYNRALRKDVLYFSSNRPGGMGGMDIWCSAVERNGTFGKPFPLPFNTAADEVTPFFHQPNQVLYFSSKSADSQTGYDIYKSSNTWTGSGDSHWSVPEKLEKPFNSKYDDLYFTWHAGSGKAYFSSNRPGSSDFDIYEADIQTEFIAQVFDAVDSSAIMGCKFQLHQLPKTTAAALPGLVDGVETKFLLEAGKSYRLVSTAIGYQPDTIELITAQEDIFSTIRQSIYLKPMARLLVRTYNAIDSLPLGGVALQLGTESVGEKTFVSNKEDETEHSFLVGVGDVISLVAMKPGFVTTYVKPNAEFRFAPAPDAHLSVYLSPFTEAPVALYFDNDEPRWVNPMDTETQLTYEQTFQTFMERRQVFLKKYVEGLPDDEAQVATEKMNSFFEEDVQANYDRLDRLCKQLVNYLEKGYELEVLAVGEASPLASTDYNNRLIARRISSVVNQLRVWNNGALSHFFDNGQLVVSSRMKIMEGEGEKVQVKLSDRRQSEFSPEVSKMRKVVIEGVKRQKPKV